MGILDKHKITLYAREVKRSSEKCTLRVGVRAGEEELSAGRPVPWGRDTRGGFLKEPLRPWPSCYRAQRRSKAWSWGWQGVSNTESSP